MNNYCRLSHMKTDMAGVSGTSLDATYLRAMEVASREIETYCNRSFHAVVATKYLDGNGKRDLMLPAKPDLADLLSISALVVDADDDGTYELTLVEGTDFRLWPVNDDRKWRIDLLTRGSQLGVWPVGQSSVKVTGTWGYSEELDSTGLTGTVATTSGTTLTASADASALIFAGDTIKVESEQMYVSAVSTTQVTVVRGVNGTTAAAHSAAAISVRRYPRDIEEATKLRALAQRWEVNQGEPLGEVNRGYDLSYPRYRGLIDRFRLGVV